MTSSANWGWLLPGVDLRNLGLTPEFDVTAPLAARIWTGLTGQKVDGVMAIDVAGVKQLLAVTGPVVADGQTISADNVEQYLLHDQYVGLTDAAAGGQQRQDALGTLTKAVLHQLEGQSTDLRVARPGGVQRGGRTQPDDVVEQSESIRPPGSSAV